LPLLGLFFGLALSPSLPLSLSPSLSRSLSLSLSLSQTVQQKPVKTFTVPGVLHIKIITIIHNNIIITNIYLIFIYDMTDGTAEAC